MLILSPFLSCEYRLLFLLVLPSKQPITAKRTYSTYSLRSYQQSRFFGASYSMPAPSPSSYSLPINKQIAAIPANHNGNNNNSTNNNYHNRYSNGYRIMRNTATANLSTNRQRSSASSVVNSIKLLLR